MKNLFTLSFLFGSFFYIANSQAAVISYSDFTDVSNLSVNGDAATTNTSDGTVLRLTKNQTYQSGSIFSNTTVNAADFSTFFTFRITEPGGTLFDGNTVSGADGLVFVAQSVSSSIGGAGAGIGYSGINHSIGIEFDTWHNSANNDPNSNHIGIDINGNVNHGAGSPHTVGVNTRFDDGNLWYAWVDYNGTTLEIRANQTGARPVNALLSQNLNLVNILGQNDAYIGFTSGTGADYGNHDIINWEYRDSFNPIYNSIPEPSSLVLLGLGLTGFGFLRKKKKA